MTPHGQKYGNVRFEACTKQYLFMQLPCVIMRDIIFFAGIFTFLVCLRFKQTKKVKITTKNILSQKITQGGWIYKIIQFNLIEKCANFFYENPRNMKGARYLSLIHI